MLCSLFVFIVVVCVGVVVIEIGAIPAKVAWGLYTGSSC